jgi:hypothetical protein
MVDGMAALTQRGADPGSNRRVVLGYQNAHASSLITVVACGVLTHGAKLRVILICDNMLPDIAG